MDILCLNRDIKLSALLFNHLNSRNKTDLELMIVELRGDYKNGNKVQGK